MQSDKELIKEFFEFRKLVRSESPEQYMPSQEARDITLKLFEIKKYLESNAPKKKTVKKK